MGVHSPAQISFPVFSVSIYKAIYILHGDVKGVESLCKKGKRNVNYYIILEYQSGQLL